MSAFGRHISVSTIIGWTIVRSHSPAVRRSHGDNGGSTQLGRVRPGPGRRRGLLAPRHAPNSQGRQGGHRWAIRDARDPGARRARFPVACAPRGGRMVLRPRWRPHLLGRRHQVRSDVGRLRLRPQGGAPHLLWLGTRDPCPGRVFADAVRGLHAYGGTARAGARAPAPSRRTPARRREARADRESQRVHHHGTPGTAPGSVRPVREQTTRGRVPRPLASPVTASREAPIGIEPMNGGFADLCLTTWLRRRGRQYCLDDGAFSTHPNRPAAGAKSLWVVLWVLFFNFMPV